MFKIPQLTLIAVLSCLLAGCVERFYPDEDDLTTGVLVINAHITDNPGVQSIEITRSGGLNFAGIDPVVGCYAVLFREDGESRDFFQISPGNYSSDLDSDFLQTGMSFQIQVITPDAEEYHSDFDKIRPVPEIDSLYYQVESMSFQTEEDAIEGIRYYLDFTFDDKAYEYIRWELTETYEFHNPEMDAYVALNRWRTIALPDSSNWRTCYITKRIQDIHTISMDELEQGVYIKKPFTFVPNDNIEQKLLYKYSLLVRQLSVGPEAFHYWNELKNTSQGQGQIFSTQPALLKSNICNINDESEKVLGFFTMSGLQEKRAMVEDIPGFDQRPYKYYCLPTVRGPGVSVPSYYPTYFARATYDGSTIYDIVNKHCVDCRAYKGSTHIKPDFW